MTIDTWDSGAHGADWDSGLQWDVNSGPSFGDVAPYLELVTSEHNQQPKFVSMLAAVFQPIADIIFVTNSFPSLYDVDEAVGQQLDTVGLWVGVSRNVTVPLAGVYFSFDDPLLGFGQGTWFSSFNPISGLVVLDDPSYRILLRARIANNAWNGTIPGAYEVWNAAFTGTGIGILIQDLENMHMILALTGPIPDAVTLALFTGGYLNIKPAGVRIDAYLTPTVPSAPYFGFDLENSSISGFDVGAFGKLGA